MIEESHVEAGVVRGERRVAREGQEPPHRVLEPGSAAELRVVQAGQPRDRRREGDARLDERLERLGDLELPHAHGPDLAYAVAGSGEPGRLEVEHDDLGVLDREIVVRVVREADAAAEPAEPRVPLHDVGEERVGERLGRTLEREEHARRLHRADRAAASLNQLDESIGRVEAPLHRRSLYEHMFAFKAKRRAALASGPSQSWLGVPSP